MSSSQDTENPRFPGCESLPPRAAELILEAVSALRFGTVEITVHDGAVVQVEKRERIRFKT